MRCDKVLDEYCTLDKNESLPFAISMHIMMCPHCKEIISKMQLVSDLPPANRMQKTRCNLISKTMQKINALENTEAIKQRRKNNLIVYLMIVVSITLPFIILPLLNFGKMLIETMGVFFVLSLMLWCTLMILLICALFVIKNSAYFTKRFSTTKN